MAWTDHWHYVRYGVLTLAGIAAATLGIVSYVDLAGDEYVTTDAYAAALLGTVERCHLTATAIAVTTNTSTVVSLVYIPDPSGAMWTLPNGTPTNYLIPSWETNTITTISTNLSYPYGVAPPGIVTWEKITAGRVIAGYTTNYADTNGLFHASPPEDPATNVGWTVAAIFTNDSPAVYTNLLTNAVTPYISATSIVVLLDKVKALIPKYANTNTAPNYDAWTVTGMFAACGVGDGTDWATNDSCYLHKTNFAELYRVLDRLEVFRLHQNNKRVEIAWTDYRGRDVTNVPSTNSFEEAAARVEADWPSAPIYTNQPDRQKIGMSTAFASWTGLDYTNYWGIAGQRVARPFLSLPGWFHFGTNVTYTTTNVVIYFTAEKDGDIFESWTSGVSTGENIWTGEVAYATSSGVAFQVVGAPPDTFAMSWPVAPEYSTLGYRINWDDYWNYSTPPRATYLLLATTPFTYCTNAP